MNNGRGAINPAMQAKAGALFSQMQSMADPSNVVQLDTQGGGIAGKFPIQLGSANARDGEMSVRQQAINKDGVVPGMGVAIADQSVFDYLEQKKEDVFLAQFQAYVNAQANLGNPAEAAWWIERFPWLKQKRLEEIDRVSDLQKRLAYMQVTGIQNEDDMKLMFAIQQNLIKVPTVALQNLNLDPRYAANTKGFMKGLFSPLSQKPSTAKDGVGMPLPLTQTPKWGDPIVGRQTGTFPTLPSIYTQMFPNA